jgi:putative transcriptional regulator
MGERKLKVSDVVRQTKLPRSAVRTLYYENAQRVDLETIDKLCTLFGCTTAELLEHRPDQPESSST